MFLLLDENVPKKLKNDFPGHQVFTIKERRYRQGVDDRFHKAHFQL